MWYNTPVNSEIIKFIQYFSNPFLDKFFLSVTMLGGEMFFTIAILGVFWCINKEFGYRLAFIFLSNGLVNTGLKDALKIPRPIGETGIRSLGLETADGYSFPSGHSQNAASFWVTIMLNIKRLWVYIAGAVLIMLIGLSRLYLGVHRPIDVLTGIIIGTLWVFIFNHIYDFAEKTGRKGIFLVFIIPMIVLLFIFPDESYFKVSGMVLGFYAGYIIEPRYIKFDVRSDLRGQVLKMIVGISVLLVTRMLVKTILPLSLVSDFIRYLLIAVWATIGAPFVFKKYITRRPSFTEKDIHAGRL